MSEKDRQESVLVTLPSGAIVPATLTTLPAAPSELEPGGHSPDALLAWIARMEQQSSDIPIGFKRYIAFCRKLCADPRMREFWDWLGSVKFKRNDMMRSSVSVSRQINRSTQLPTKPGDMTPAQRDAYFKKVRAHAYALFELLEGTRFDNDHMSELSDKKLSKSLDSNLHSWGDDEEDEGHTVAFQVTPDGKFEHHYDFPDSALTQTLMNVVDWTHWDDCWGNGVFDTSEPIVQTNSESTPVVYFCCTLHDWFHGYGVEIPFRVLATAANVSLDLPADREIDEEAARKQVRRFQQRRAKAAAQQDCPF